MAKTAPVKAVLVVLLMGVLVSSTPGCAWIFSGFKGKEAHERTADIKWGYFVLDILFTGAVGLIVDFATGAIYQSKGPGMLAFEGPLAVCDTARSAMRGSSASDLEAQARWFARHIETCGVCKEAVLAPEMREAQRLVPDGRSVIALDAAIPVNLNGGVSE